MLRGAAGLCLLLVSCTSVDDTGSALTGVEGFCARWAEAACNEDVAAQCQAEDVDDCVVGQRAACEDRLPERRFTSIDAKACLDAVEAAYEDAKLDVAERDTVIFLGPPCDKLLSGPGEGGDPCDEKGDCNTEEGFSCVFRTAGEMGECRKPMSVSGGDVCTALNAVCASGYYCNGENCIAAKTDGQMCSVDVPCADAFRCETPDAPDAGADSGSAAPASTCVAKAELGDDCAVDADCKSNMCAIATGSTVGTCARILVLSATEPICRQLR